MQHKKRRWHLYIDFLQKQKREKLILYYYGRTGPIPLGYASFCSTWYVYHVRSTVLEIFVDINHRVVFKPINGSAYRVICKVCSSGGLFFHL